MGFLAEKEIVNGAVYKLPATDKESERDLIRKAPNDQFRVGDHSRDQLIPGKLRSRQVVLLVLLLLRYFLLVQYRI